MPANPISTASTFVTVALLQSRARSGVDPADAIVAQLFVTHKMLRILPVKLKSKSQTFGIVTRKGGVLSPSAEQFVQLLRDRKPCIEAGRRQLRSYLRCGSQVYINPDVRKPILIITPARGTAS